MSFIVTLLFAIGIALAVYAIVAPEPPDDEPSVSLTNDWSDEAGREFARFSEPARCDFIFAIAALDDERATRLLEVALHDVNETVALAAAHALAGSGRADRVERFLQQCPGERAERLASTLALLIEPEREPLAVAR